MEKGRGSTRLKLGLVLGVALLAFAALFVGSAKATPEAPPSDWSGLPANSNPFDPLETNVPYLAWRGEEVRLVKCLPHEPVSINTSDLTETANGFTYNDGSLDINNQVFAYSGPSANQFHGPKPVKSSASVFYDSSTHRICSRQTWISNKAGIVIIKNTVAYDGVILIQHDFMIGWMGINTVDITNPGTVDEYPGVDPGNSVNVQVTGSIPLNSQFQEDYGLPATLVMPDDWAMWADAMATTDGNLSGYSFQPPASAFWDIHDSSGPLGNESPDGSPDVHVNTTTCPGSTADAFVDQVDNCQAGEDNFSRVFGDTTDFIGPFDPVYSGTLLSDGRLNSSDAPMPALKINFNSTGGTGGFVHGCLNAKDQVYNRVFDPTNVIRPTDDIGGEDCPPAGTTDADPGGNPSAPTDENAAHNDYAPYYDQYIPATSRDPFGAASGIDGPIYTQYTGQPNNFQGFGWYGDYENWEIAKYVNVAQGGDSGCLLNNENGDRQLNLGNTNNEDNVDNTGNTQVIEFTDEHGEARANWRPGINADFFANYANNNGEGGCDLEGVTFPNQTITASASY